MADRQNHEASALERFQAAALSRSHAPFRTQGATNRIAIAGNVYYQFGDLRVELPDVTLIVEVESSGSGTTNLAKYWECYSSKRLVKPMKLLHLFRQISPNDYEAHIIVWRFLSEKMHREIPEQFEGQLFKFDARLSSSLDAPLAVFEGWLDRALDRRAAT